MLISQDSTKTFKYVRVNTVVQVDSLIFKLYTNSFYRQRAGLEVLIKMASRGDR